MHDIVRHFSREKVGAEALRANNKILVAAALEARAVQGGTFGTLGESKYLSLNWYAQNYLSYHIQEGLSDIAADNDAICKDSLMLSLLHDTDVVLHSLAALAVGIDRAVEIAEQFATSGAEADGFVLLNGAGLTRVVMGLTLSREVEMTYRGGQMLDAAIDKAGDGPLPASSLWR